MLNSAGSYRNKKNMLPFFFVEEKTVSDRTVIFKELTFVHVCGHVRVCAFLHTGVGNGCWFG